VYVVLHWAENCGDFYDKAHEDDGFFAIKLTTSVHGGKTLGAWHIQHNTFQINEVTSKPKRHYGIRLDTETIERLEVQNCIFVTGTHVRLDKNAVMHSRAKFYIDDNLWYTSDPADPADRAKKPFDSWRMYNPDSDRKTVGKITKLFSEWQKNAAGLDANSYYSDPKLNINSGVPQGNSLAKGNAVYRRGFTNWVNTNNIGAK
jgi:hypothetical protein